VSPGIKTVRLIRDKLRDDGSYDLRGGTIDSVMEGQPLHQALLVLKIHEEVSEVQKALDDVNEYGDVLEALLTLANFNGISLDQIIKAMADKHEVKGGFEAGQILVRL
jgi:predicted house-cleaning noncanonical NTP pyrophosphatase (MazG superfamily)